MVCDLAPGAAELRRWTGRFLPEYMVPNTVTVLSALPLTPNGKVDVARLPAPTAALAAETEHPADADEGHVSDTEKTRRICELVLGVPVTEEDDFFELGGNSLLAIRIFHALDDAGISRVSLEEFYRRPTVKSLVAVRNAVPISA